MNSLADILHNIADHTQTLLHLLNDESVAPDITERLKRHMLLEEHENTSLLQNLEPSSITQKLLDHSFFIQRMMQEEAMSKELKLELLDHFMEEHQDWMTEISADSSTRRWTVGPMWPQGG